MAAPTRQPAIPLMIGDYFKDPLLGQASLLSRGAWFELLLYMWEGDKRGEIETTIYGLNRLLGAGSIDEILFFLNELNDLEFGDLFATDEKNALVFPLTLENCNGKVTIRNRRMYADYKDRQNTRLRVRKYRETKKKRPMKQKCNADVTPSLSVSISITKKYKKEFLVFYQKYPVKKSQESALKAYLKHKPDLDVILKAIDLQIAEKKELNKAGKFCPEWPNPATWINGKRWTDEIKYSFPSEEQPPPQKEFSLEIPDNMLTPEELQKNVSDLKQTIQSIGGKK